MQCCDHQTIVPTDDAGPPAEVVENATAVLLIHKMDCPTEEKLIRDRFAGMAGIDSMQFNLMQRELTVRHHLLSTDPIVAALKTLDLDPVLKADTLAVPGALAAQGADLSGDYRISPTKWVLMGISGVAAVTAEVVA